MVSREEHVMKILKKVTTKTSKIYFFLIQHELKIINSDPLNLGFGNMNPYLNDLAVRDQH